MDTYRPRKFRRHFFKGAALRVLLEIAHHWPVILLAVVILSPVGPHLRLQYTYLSERDGPHLYIDCTYFGSRGLIRSDFGGKCPLIKIIDARTFK